MFGCFFISARKPSRRSIPVRLVWSCTMTATSPESPINSAILSAASPAAATLSVLQVVSGMSLSTPESKAMTGIFSACAFFSNGMAACESSAAKPIALGCLARSAESMSICLSTIASVSGPSKVILTLSALACSSAPCFTACQNWCWKPLETRGMKGWSARAPAESPIAVRAPSATPICHFFNMVFSSAVVVVCTAHFPPVYPPGGGGLYWFWPSFECDASSRAFAAQDVHVNGQNDDQAGHHELPFRGDREDAQAVGEHAYDEGADDCAEDGSGSAAQRRAADDDGGDRFEFIALAERWLRRIQPRGDEKPGDAANCAVETVDRGLPQIHVHAREPNGLLVAANNKRVAAEQRPGEHKGACYRERKQDQHGVGNGQIGKSEADRRGLRDHVEVGRIVEIDRLVGGNHQGKSLEHHHHAQSGDEGREFHFRRHGPRNGSAQGAGPDRGDDARPHRQSPIGQNDAANDGAKGHQRSDGKIDASGDDHEGAGDRQYAVDGRRLQDAQHVFGLHERGREEAENNQHDNEAREGEQFLQ